MKAEKEAAKAEAKGRKEREKQATKEAKKDNNGAEKNAAISQDQDTKTVEAAPSDETSKAAGTKTPKPKKRGRKAPESNEEEEDEGPQIMKRTKKARAKQESGPNRTAAASSVKKDSKVQKVQDEPIQPNQSRRRSSRKK